MNILAEGWWACTLVRTYTQDYTVVLRDRGRLTNWTPPYKWKTARRSVQAECLYTFSIMATLGTWAKDCQLCTEKMAYFRRSFWEQITKLHEYVCPHSDVSKHPPNMHIRVFRLGKTTSSASEHAESKKVHPKVYETFKAKPFFYVLPTWCWKESYQTGRGLSNAGLIQMKYDFS